MNTLDALRVAAKNYAAAESEHSKLVQFGAHQSAANALERLKAVTRELVRAADLHAAREYEGIAELIRTGHTFTSAKRIKELRGDTAPAAKRTRKPRAIIPKFSEMVDRSRKNGQRALDRLASQAKRDADFVADVTLQLAIACGGVFKPFDHVASVEPDLDWGELPEDTDIMAGGGVGWIEGATFHGVTP